jgi:hypothetical protein
MDLAMRNGYALCGGSRVAAMHIRAFFHAFTPSLTPSHLMVSKMLSGRFA